MALRGIKVIELAGLAPAPFCGLILADFGADVVRIDKPGSEHTPTFLDGGKRSIAIDMKSKEGIGIIRKMCKQVDVLIEPFRKGVMERLGVGPNILLKDNPRLVYARLTGFGQDGPLSERAGHDINYLAISGVLSRLGRHNEKPYAPVNLLADFAGGSLICALGITMALYERTVSGQGQVIDANMVEGAAYVASFLWASQHMPLWDSEKGKGWLDGGAPWYDTYETKDGLFMSVGAIEPQFYAKFVQGIGLNPDEMPQFGDWSALREKFTEIFKTKTQNEWSEIFETCDACVMPVVQFNEAPHHRHNVARNAFFTDAEGSSFPRPAPKLSRSPAQCSVQHPKPGQHTQEVLAEFGFSENEIKQLLTSGYVQQLKQEAKL